MSQSSYLGKLLSFRKLFVHLLREVLVWLQHLTVRHDAQRRLMIDMQGSNSDSGCSGNRKWSDLGVRVQELELELRKG